MKNIHNSGNAECVDGVRNGEMNDVRMEKVLELKERIAAGTYRVSAEDVAEKVMGSMLL